MTAGVRWTGEPERCGCTRIVVATLEETLTCPYGWRIVPGTGWVHTRWLRDPQPEDSRFYLGRAQVHATLALAAAVVGSGGFTLADRHEWQKAIDPDYAATSASPPAGPAGGTP